MTPLTIGKIAERADVTVETVRFYERKGLINQPPRIEGKYRHYPNDTVSRIEFIKRAQQLGFTLTEIHELLELHTTGNQPCDDVRERAVKKIADIQDKMESLLRMKSVLGDLVETCERRDLTESECPIMEALEGREHGKS